MELGLEGKYALVTGGTHGIGRSIAVALAKEGCNVAVCSRTVDRLEDTMKELKAIGVEYIGIQADVMIEADVRKTMEMVINRWGTIHILVNNAGGGGRWGSEIIEETQEQVWLDVYNKNVLSSIRFTMQAIPFMRRQKWGRVVAITSVYGRQGGGRPWFNVAKTAQTAFIKNLALNHKLVRDGITFNSIAPGDILISETGWGEAFKQNPEQAREYEDRELPLGRLGTPEEVANLVTFICSEKASLINGASIPIDGGQGISII